MLCVLRSYIHDQPGEIAAAFFVLEALADENNLSMVA